jgi:tetratricopeptide (TPR) repeat protein
MGQNMLRILIILSLVYVTVGSVNRATAEDCTTVYNAHHLDCLFENIPGILARIYLRHGDKQTAARLVEYNVLMAFSRGTPHDQIQALVQRSEIYALAFEYDAAIADMDQAIELATELAPDSLPYLYVERGQRILLLYQWDRVLADYNHALELNPNYAPAYFHRGVLFYTQGPRENALDDFRRYLELAPDGKYNERAEQYITAIEAELAVLNP